MSREWPKVAESKKSIRKAGDVLRTGTATPDERAAARATAKAWRSAHQYPMNTWQNRVRSYVKDVDALVAQRLKRLPSIERKLNRFKNSQLDTMQDLGGVRVVLPSVEEVRRVEMLLLDRPNAHVLKGHDDYLVSPKPDGYRSIHIVYAYGTVPPTAWETYRIEIQIRTQLQHYWATALETVDLFTEQGLKFGTGEDWWREFFALMSSEIAAREGLPIVPGTPSEAGARQARLNEIDEQYDALSRLQGFRHVVKTSSAGEAEGKYVLLDLDLDRQVLETTGFDDKKVAARAYAELETLTRENSLRDVVLVAVDDARKLPLAYPNYFVNLDSFIHLAQWAMALNRDEEIVF
jgi:hypothetical protein